MIEFWVLRVLSPDELTIITPAMMSELECVNGEICEPIQAYQSQTEATARALSEHRRTGKVHKVTLVA